MRDPASPQSFGREISESLETITAAIFARHGVDFATVRRAGGWTNAGWPAEGCVLRLSTTQGNDSLLRRAVEGLARPLLVQPWERDLLPGYAILLEVWLLETWLTHPEGEGPLDQWDPLQRLRSLADGMGATWRRCCRAEEVHWVNCVSPAKSDIIYPKIKGDTHEPG